MSDIKVGDTVKLKSGGPVMTVQGMGDYSMHAAIENGADCVWFDDGNKSQNRVFDLDSLIIVEPDR